MADIVNGLFGLDPTALQAQQQAMDYNKAFKYAQLSAPEQAQFGGFLGGQQLGRAVPAMFGVEDPMLAKANLAKRLASQFDITTASGLKEYAQALAQNGAPDLAQLAIQKSNEMTTTALTQNKLTAEAIAKEREKLPTIGQLQAYREKLVAAVGPNDSRVKEVDAVIKAEGEGKGTKIIMPSEAQDKILREKRTGKFLDLEDSAISAADTLQLTRDFNNILNKAFTGTGAGIKLTASQFANALGVNVTGTTESEQLDQLFAGLTVGQAKNLKGSLSDKDVKFLKEAVGSRGLTKETLQNVIERIERNALIDQKTYDLASSYSGDMAKLNINDFRKQAQTEVNTVFEKRKRLQELKQKAGQ